MGTAESDKRIGGVAEAEKSATNFQIEIALWRACDADLPQVEDYGKKEDEGHCTGRDQRPRMSIVSGDRSAVAAEKPDDFAPITHKSPQMPTKSCQLPGDASLCPFLTGNSHA